MAAKPECVALLALVLMSTVGASRVESADWPMLGRTFTRNPVVPDAEGPIEWNVKTGKNIKWTANLGSQTYGTPVIANGQIYVGTNNGAGYLERFPAKVDLGCLLCFREADGKFLWQFSAQKLPSGRIHDWPMQGIGCPPLVEGDRMWFVSNRWEVICADTQGFRDGKNDGPYEDEAVEGPLEADIVWKLDTMATLGMSPHTAGMGPDRRCSMTAFGNYIYFVTGNGVDMSHTKVPTPDAPSLACIDKRTGKVLWTDNSPGKNILHTQVASPLVAEIAGRAQVIVPQGDGWLRSFDPKSGKLLWKFDTNAKASKWILGGRGDRNNILATPVLYENRIYICNGQEMEHGEGPARLVCLDPTKTGDISSELAVDMNGKVIAHKRYQAVDAKIGEKAIANPNSGLVWEFVKEGKEFEDEMHRTVSSVAVHNGLVIAADGAGLIHCLSAKTGERYWAYDALAAIWAAPLIVGETVYIPDEDGEMNIFRLSADPKRAMKPGNGRLAYVRGKAVNLLPMAELQFGSSIQPSPVFANGTLYITTRHKLQAIAAKKTDKPAADPTRKQNNGATPKSSQTQGKPKGTRVAMSAYVPTPRDVVDRMLVLAEVNKSDVVCDLGSGDGRIPIAAAQKFGAKGVGIEFDSELIKQSNRDAATAGVADRVTFHKKDLFDADLTKFDVLTLYLYPAQNGKLVPQLMKLKAGVRIVTHRYRLPGVQADKKLVIQSNDSGEKHTVYKYTTPLRADATND
ncbi:MAG: PQQ-binding-like beta-propeller repeat protein [Planctomycetaceae bacterium]|nr:PQQ-binding-like beta-propeller repeat protein [Planctomycetaceae bacterium]MBT6487810.1 PQQ-binding-like beta-propeller repeat protein [Planctomycetaceae bacterium]MBT6495116.1 PQQ-binding-like beta-propeller repeat protein [Planctomycetaceae bacterium]